jgi:peroxiredoxin
MNTFLNIGFALAWLAILAGGWLGWQLLRQNGRLLLRVEGLENQLNEIEFGGAEEPTGLPIGAEAPAFELPDLAGERKSLTQFRGQPLLLIFFHPDCGFCREMMPKLAALPSEGRAPRVLDSHNVKEDKGLVELGPPVDGMDGKSRLVIITSGDVEKNRQLFAEHKVSCPVLLQKDSGVATTYRSHGTPSGYLIDPAGKIASELAMGAEALLALAKGKAESGKQNTEMEQNVSGAAGTAAGNGDGSASRFGGRSLARSKIKRDGLKAGTPAPDFRLPRLDGKGDLSLSELRGKRVVLVFSSPGCGPCNTIAPELEKFHRSHSPLTPSLSPSDGRGWSKDRERGRLLSS